MPFPAEDTRCRPAHRAARDDSANSIRNIEVKQSLIPRTLTAHATKMASLSINMSANKESFRVRGSQSDAGPVSRASSSQLANGHAHIKETAKPIRLIFWWSHSFRHSSALFTAVAHNCRPSSAPSAPNGQPVRLPPSRSGLKPRPGHSGLQHVGIVPDDAVGRRVFSGISHFPRPFIPALLHTIFNHSHRLSIPRYQNSHGCAVFVRLVFNTTSQELDSALGSPLFDDRPVMNAVEYRVVSGVVWTNRTMASYNAGTNRTGVLAVVYIGDSLCVSPRRVQTLPVVRRGLKDLRCCDGDAVTLECRVQATPAPDVRWEKGGRLLPLGGDIVAEFDGETARLTIQQVYPEDEGEYTCVVYNELGKASTSACLVVDGELRYVASVWRPRRVGDDSRPTSRTTLFDKCRA
ncbi:hypothetical protein PR048_003472 [Dryococelus australis]|uniref:Ig-like domain-containing protein n=1 Tax=Dryococelus australis TaxID=614101 RepID=A0ABQ9IN79_9NEOP|nr:hypothetical protein PR048_003472 [Dryococelus australis]